MKVATNTCVTECSSVMEIEGILYKSSLNPCDDVWISGEKDYPCLAILINGDQARVHFFLNDRGDVWQAVGTGEENVMFFFEGEQLEVPADSVISLERAVECMEEFYATGQRPECMEWREL